MNYCQCLHFLGLRKSRSQKRGRRPVSGRCRRRKRRSDAGSHSQTIARPRTGQLASGGQGRQIALEFIRRDEGASVRGPRRPLLLDDRAGLGYPQGCWPGRPATGRRGIRVAFGSRLKGTFRGAPGFLVAESLGSLHHGSGGGFASGKLTAVIIDIKKSRSLRSMISKHSAEGTRVEVWVLPWQL